MRFLTLFLLSLSLLQAEPKTYAYRCDDGFDFVVRFEEGRTWLFAPGFGGQLLFIEKGPRGGTLYEGDGAVLDFRGRNAALILKGERHENCRNDRKRAIWEDAKLRGVDFRAVGNEPPWILEITGERLDFYFGYDRRHYRFEASPKSDAEKRVTRYESKGSKTPFVVTLRPGPCADSMADESYETKVSVTFGGRRLQGCGQALH